MFEIQLLFRLFFLGVSCLISRFLHESLLIQELKGNIRVFCRVRPLTSDDGVITDPKVISFPTSTELLGRGIDISQNGEYYRVFMCSLF